MKTKNNSLSPSIGIASLLVVFLILCLVTFAVLSLSTARSNYQFSEKSAQNKTAYYEASNVSQKILFLIEKTVVDESPLTGIQDICNILDKKLTTEYPYIDISFITNGNEITASWAVDISNKRVLAVAVDIYPQSDINGNTYQINKYQVVSTQNGDYNQNVKLIK